MTILPHEKQVIEYEKTINSLKEQGKKDKFWTQEEIGRLEKKLELLKKKVYSKLSPWERVLICRHAQRPHTLDYLQNIGEDFCEIFGDRTFQDDHAIICGFIKISGQKFVAIGLEKGNDTESRIFRNFGMAHPEGYRKALRAMQLAEKFHLPIISFLDTPGAYPGLSAEERGQGWAIAKNLMEMSKIATPIIILLIGEGCSGGALGIGIGDSIGMLEHSYYSVISPEGCASVLWKDPSKNCDAAVALKMQSEDLAELNIIDEIIKEPLGGAHHDPKLMFERVKKFISEKHGILKNIPIKELLDRRYKKFRNMGTTTTDAGY